MTTRWDERGAKCYPDALLDKVILVTLKLRLEARRLGPVCRLVAFYPGIVSRGLWLLGRGLPDTIPCILVAGDIGSLLGLEDGCLEGFDAEREARLAYEEEAIESSAACEWKPC